MAGSSSDSDSGRGAAPVLVEAHGLFRVYPDRGIPGGRVALGDIDLTVRAGEFVTLVGRSGSGKTTLLNILGGLDSGWTGSVSMFGRNLAAMSDRELSVMRNTRIGFVFQAFNLLSHLTVVENVLLPAHFGTGKSSTFQAAARLALQGVGLLDRSDSFPWQLSAGEKQRVAIARAMLNRPELLLCDEPTGNLDQVTGAAIIDIFREINSRDGVTLVVATHEERMAAASGRTVHIESGRLA